MTYVGVDVDEELGRRAQLAGLSLSGWLAVRIAEVLRDPLPATPDPEQPQPSPEPGASPIRSRASEGDPVLLQPR